MTDLQMLGNSYVNLAWYQRTKDLVPLFDLNVYLIENSLLKVLAQLHWLVFKAWGYGKIPSLDHTISKKVNWGNASSKVWANPGKMLDRHKNQSKWIYVSYKICRKDIELLILCFDYFRCFLNQVCVFYKNYPRLINGEWLWDTSSQFAAFSYG